MSNPSSRSAISKYLEYCDRETYGGALQTIWPVPVQLTVLCMVSIDSISSESDPLTTDSKLLADTEGDDE